MSLPQLVSVLREACGQSSQEEVYRRREEGLKKKDLELQASLIRFSKFLQARPRSPQDTPARIMHPLSCP